MPPIPLPRRDILRLAALGGLAAVAACTSTPEQPTSPTSQRQWGAFIPEVLPREGVASTPIARLTELAGSSPHYLHRFVSFGDSLPTADLDAIAASGAVPLLSLEPWDPGGGTVQPLFSLARIASGVFDGELRKWASSLTSWGKPVLLRFAQEMNGTWYPWSIGVSGNTAEQYRAAWLRMHSIFDDAHADNVRFVWAPNVLTAGTTDFTSAFPGHDHVDYLGLDGYNWGDGSGHRWQWPEELFPDSLSTLARLDSDRPILITEVASTDGTTPDAKADWIRRFFGIVEATDRLEGALWFQVDKERDWRFNSTPQSLNAFREAIAKLQGT